MELSKISFIIILILLFIFACYCQYYWQHDIYIEKKERKKKINKISSINNIKKILSNNIKCVKLRNIYITSILSIILICLFNNRIISSKEIVSFIFSIVIALSIVGQLNMLSYNKQYELGKYYLKNLV